MSSILTSLGELGSYGRASYFWLRLRGVESSWSRRFSTIEISERDRLLGVRVALSCRSGAGNSNISRCDTRSQTGGEQRVDCLPFEIVTCSTAGLR